MFSYGGLDSGLHYNSFSGIPHRLAEYKFL